MKWRAIRIAAAVPGKLVSDEAEECPRVDMDLPMLVRVRAALVHGPTICQPRKALVSAERPALYGLLRHLTLLLLLASAPLALPAAAAYARPRQGRHIPATGRIRSRGRRIDVVAF